MTEIFVVSWIESFIKSHAKSSNREIYGWLLGFETSTNDLVILSAIDCQRYEMQTFTGARPDPREVQEISASLPQNTGIVGIYHSHPGEVFHSHHDNFTLENLSRMYEGMISVVTNGKEINWYRLDKNNKLSVINIIPLSLPIMDIITFSIVKMELSFEMNLDANLPLIPQASRFLLEWFNNNIDNLDVKIVFFDLSMDDKKIGFQDLFGEEPCIIKDILSSSNNIIINKFSSIDKKDLDDFIIDNHPALLHLFSTDKLGRTQRENFIKASGCIELNGIIIKHISFKELDIKRLMNKIREDLFDDLILKSSRGIINFIDEKDCKIIFPKTIYIPHANLPLKYLFLDDNISNINIKTDSKNHLSSVTLKQYNKQLQLEKTQVDTMVERSRTLASANLKEMALELLKVLKSISIKKKFNKILDRIETLYSLINIL
ncbi:MAG: Mov34/MPN/PAD-1 family protein [Promethearchaeota archaeon]